MRDEIAHARELAQAGDLDGAIASLRSALTTAPADAELQLYLAVLLGRRGDHAAAIDLLERARAAIPADKHARIDAALAGYYDAVGRADDAVAACRAALARDAQLVPPALLLATHLARRGQREEALRIYRDLVDRVQPHVRPMVLQAIESLKGS